MTPKQIIGFILQALGTGMDKITMEDRLTILLSSSAEPSPKKYSHKRYNQLLEDTFRQVISLSALKGGEYSGDEDRLENFRRNARDAGCSMELVWRIYAGKHWDAITQYVKDISTGKERQRMESLSGRADDLITYLLLFKAILEEHSNYLPSEKTVDTFQTSAQPESHYAKATPVTGGVGVDQHLSDPKSEAALDVLRTIPRNDSIDSRS